MHRFLAYSLTIACGLLFAGTIANTNPAPPPEAVWTDTAAASPVEREITIPAGTILRLRPAESFGSDISRIEQPVTARLARAVLVNGHTALPAGSTAYGVITEARRAGKVKGRARVGVRFTQIAHNGQRYSMRTRSWVALAPATKKKDAMTIGIPAAGGAAIGAIVGGKKGAAIGAAAGGGSGTAVVLTTRGKEVRVGRGATLAVRLSEPLTVEVR